jgi:hypothetical protein
MDAVTEPKAVNSSADTTMGFNHAARTGGWRSIGSILLQEADDLRSALIVRT